MSGDLRGKMATALAGHLGVLVEYEQDKRVTASIDKEVADLLRRMEKQGVTIAACEPKEYLEIVDNSQGSGEGRMIPPELMEEALIKAGFAYRDEEGYLQPTERGEKHDNEGKLIGFDIEFDEDGEMQVRVLTDEEVSQGMKVQ